MSIPVQLMTAAMLLASGNVLAPPGKFKTWGASKMYSANNGVSWDAGTTTTPALISIYKAVRLASGRIVAMLNAGAGSSPLVYSDDNGVTWTTAATIAAAPTSTSYRLFERGGNLYADVTAGSAATKRFSADNGATWSAVPNIPGGATTHLLCPYRGNQIALMSPSSPDGWISSDSGATWTPYTFPIPEPAYTVDLPSGRSVLIGARNAAGIATRAWSDDGVTWNTINFSAVTPGVGINSAEYVPALQSVVVCNGAADGSFQASNADATVWTSYDIASGSAAFREFAFDGARVMFIREGVLFSYVVSALPPTPATGALVEACTAAVWIPDP